MSVGRRLVKSGAAAGGVFVPGGKPVEHVAGDARRGVSVAERQGGARHRGEGVAVGDDGKSFKLIAFRAAETELGQALLSSPADQRWWLAGTIKRDEWNGGNAAEMHLEDAAPA